MAACWASALPLKPGPHRCPQGEGACLLSLVRKALPLIAFFLIDPRVISGLWVSFPFPSAGQASIAVTRHTHAQGAESRLSAVPYGLFQGSRIKRWRVRSLSEVIQNFQKRGKDKVINPEGTYWLVEEPVPSFCGDFFFSLHWLLATGWHLGVWS